MACSSDRDNEREGADKLPPAPGADFDLVDSHHMVVLPWQAGADTQPAEPEANAVAITQPAEPECSAAGKADKKRKTSTKRATGAKKGSKRGRKKRNQATGSATDPAVPRKRGRPRKIKPEPAPPPPVQEEEEQPMSACKLDVDLLFHYHLTWGYPDFVREATKILLAQGRLPEAIDEEMSWHQVRTILEACSNQRIKYFVAGQDGTSAAVLNYLASDESANTCLRVAENPHCHEMTLAKLAQHESAEVRCAVSEHPNTSAATLEKLAQDENPDVRYYIAENVRTSMDILSMLAQDDNPFVSFRAQRTLKNASPAANVVPGEFVWLDRPRKKTSG